MSNDSTMNAAAKVVILYDGVCGLCDRLVKFVLKRDRKDAFRFASLQSPFAAQVLARHGLSADQLSTVYVVLDSGSPSEQVVDRFDAVLAVLDRLGGAWRAAGIARLFPRSLRDWAYNFVARRRYKVFGKFESCPLPRPEDRAKFLDI